MVTTHDGNVSSNLFSMVVDLGWRTEPGGTLRMGISSWKQHGICRLPRHGVASAAAGDRQL